MKNIGGIFRRSLGLKIAFWMTLALFFCFSVIIYINFTTQKKMITSKEERAANALTNTILVAIRYPMSKGKQEVIQKQLELIKEENEDIFVHLTDEKRVIKRSTEPGSIGIKAEPSKEYLREGFSGKEVRKTVTKKTGETYYEEIKPISNQPACHTCHGSKKPVLGFLWTGKDFSQVKAAVASLGIQNIFLSIIGLLIVALLIFFLSRSMFAPLQSFVKMANEIAQGDLTQDIEVRSEDEVGRVGSAFNMIVFSLRKMVGDVINAAENIMNSAQQFSNITQQMNDGVQQINSAMSQISAGVTEQTGKIDNVSKVLDNVKFSLKGIEGKVKITADGSEFAASQVNISGEKMMNLSDKMDRVNETVNESVELIKSLEERSQQIGEITVTITNIADQTNLLSLNAAIEAARAGEAGLGFGVVADEIRKLAESSAQAASRIGSLIRNIQDGVTKTITSIEVGSQQVSEGRDVVAEVRTSLNKVISSVNEASKSSHEIAIAINEDLAVGTGEAVKAIEDVSTIAQQTSSSIQETTSSVEEQSASMQEIANAAQDLSRLAKEMKALVEQFKLA